MCEIWMETGDHAESQNRLLQLGVLETESETELKVQYFYHEVEINTCGREWVGSRVRQRKGNEPECYLDKRPQFFPWGTQELGWPFRDARIQMRGLDLYIPARTNHCMRVKEEEGTS